MPAPHQITAHPLTLWISPVGTAMPKVDTAPAVAWVKIGTEGARDYDAEGVTVTHSQSIETFTGAASTAPRKAFRTDEGLTLGFSLADLSPEQYAKLVDDATVTTTAAGASTPGNKAFSLLKGLEVSTFALLARGQSTVDNGLALQYEFKNVFQSGEPAPVFAKGSPAMLSLEFTALEESDGGLGTLRIQTAAATA
jgi:hypothetical protein